MPLLRLDPKMFHVDPRTISRELGLLRMPAKSTVLSAGISQAKEKSQQKPKRPKVMAPARMKRASNEPLLTPEEVNLLRQDLRKQLQVRPPAEAVQVIPDTEVQQKAQGILEKKDSGQTSAGLLGGLVGATAAGGLGAITTGMAKGIEKAPSGLLMAIPGAMKGYRLAKKLKQDHQIGGLLADEYQQPKPEGLLAQHSGEKVGSSLDDLLEHLFPKKDAKKPPIESKIPPSKPPGYRPSFQERQGKQTARIRARQEQRGLLGPKKFEPKRPETMKLEPKTVKLKDTKPKGFGPKTKRPPMPQNLKQLVKKNPKTIAIMGGLAALGALGLTASQLRKYRSDAGTYGKTSE